MIMKKYATLLLCILILSLAVTLFASCGKDKSTTDLTTDPVTTGKPETSTEATTEKPSVTTPESTTPATTEKPREPATPGLTYTSLGNGLCSVSGILDAGAEKLVIPEKNSKGEFVVSIEKDAFALNTKIKELILYGASEEIGSSAFYGCTSLEKVTLESKTRTISSSAFRSCTALAEVNLSAGIETVDVSAFNGCSSLKILTVDPENKTYRAEGNCLIKGDTVVIGCIGSVIPESVSKIGPFAFDGMNISNPVLPGTVKSVGEQAYANNPFTFVKLPEGLETLGDAVFYNCQQLTSVSLPASLKTVGKRLFQACLRVEELTVAKESESFYAEGVCLIEKESGTLLQGVRLSAIPEGVKKIGDYAFYGAMVKSLTVPEGVSEIGERAFYNCAYLTELTIPASVKKLADDALAKCDALTTITYDGVEADWNMLTATVTIPEAVTVIFLKEETPVA